MYEFLGTERYWQAYLTVNIIKKHLKKCDNLCWIIDYLIPTSALVHAEQKLSMAGLEHTCQELCSPTHSSILSCFPPPSGPHHFSDHSKPEITICQTTGWNLNYLESWGSPQPRCFFFSTNSFKFKTWQIWVTNVFCEGPESTHFQVWRPRGLCLCSTLPV